MQPLGSKQAANIGDPVPENKKSRRVGITVGLFLVLISVAITSTFLVIGGALVFRNVEALFWRHTTGELLDARIEQHGTGENRTPAVPVVHYRYTVEGRSYTSDHWSPAGLGIDMAGEIERLKRAHPLTVYYNPMSPSDCAVVLPSINIGFLPFVLGLGLFFVLVLAICGGILFAAIHPELAGGPNSSVRRWIVTCLRIGFALTITSLTGVVTMVLHSSGGWWQWALSVIAVVFAVRRPKSRDVSDVTTEVTPTG